MNCTLFNSFIVHKKSNATKKIKYKDFLLQLEKNWASDDSAAEDVLDHKIIRSVVNAIKMN